MAHAGTLEPTEIGHVCHPFFFLLINFWPFVPQQHTPLGPSTTKRINEREEREDQINFGGGCWHIKPWKKMNWWFPFPAKKKKLSFPFNAFYLFFYHTPPIRISPNSRVIQLPPTPLENLFTFRPESVGSIKFRFFFLLLVNFSCIITRLSVGYTSDRRNPVVMCDVCVLTY